MNILEKIVAVKHAEVAKAKGAISIQELERSEFFHKAVNSLEKSLLSESSSGIIAEFKRASPSKGDINSGADINSVVNAYATNGAAGISVLTDQDFFKARNDDFKSARLAVPGTPILRKDFMIDEYQLIEAKSWGADVILLIAACLSPSEVQQLARFARQLQLEVLLEIHNEEELAHICDEVNFVGVNNRNLKTFTVDTNTSKFLSPLIPAGKLKISESGISTKETMSDLKLFGFHGFLIGENFMKEPDPAIAFARFVEQSNSTQTL